MTFKLIQNTSINNMGYKIHNNLWNMLWEEVELAQ